MPMKDRLEELHAKRELLEKSGKKSEGSGSNKKMTGQQLQNFLAEVGKIESDLAKMKDDISSIKRLQQDMLSTPFQEKSSSARYESIAADIRQDATKIGIALKQLEKKYCESGDETLLRLRSQQMSTLTTELNLATNEYFKTQAQYMDKMKTRIHRQLHARGDTIDESKMDEIFDQGSYSVFTENYVMDVVNTEQTLRDLEGRKNDILKLEKGISDVNQLFMDLNLMVADQGESIATIEQSVDKVTVRVESGNKQLMNARDNQSRARRKKIWILAIIIVVLLVLGIILAVVFAATAAQQGN